MRICLPILLEHFIQIGLLGIASQIVGGYVYVSLKSKLFENIKWPPFCFLLSAWSQRCWWATYYTWEPVMTLGLCVPESPISACKACPLGTAAGSSWWFWDLEGSVTGRGSCFNQSCSGCISLERKLPSLEHQSLETIGLKHFLDFYLCVAYPGSCPCWIAGRLRWGTWHATHGTALSLNQWDSERRQACVCHSEFYRGLV